MKSLEDGKRIKRFLSDNRVGKVVVIGMGYIALEMVEALRTRNMEVDMVKPRPIFLPWLEKSLAQVVKEEVESKGVSVYAGHEVKQIEQSNGTYKVVCSDLTLEGDMVLVGIGVKPNTDFAGQSGIELSIAGSIAVDRGLRSSDENIYAAGDCADAYHAVTGKKTWVPLALRANRAGWAVADNVCGKKTTLPGVVGSAVFRVFDLEVARTGLNSQEAGENGFDPVEVTIQTRTRAHAHPGSSTLWINAVGDKTSGRLLGMQMVGKEGAAHRINAAAVALHCNMTVEQFSQSDMAYAPPFSPVWDPMLTTANQLLKQL